MHCPRCQHENRPQAKFCEECGAPSPDLWALRGCALHLGRSSVPSVDDPPASMPGPRPGSRPRTSYTPKHLAEKILTSKAALEGERKQVTVLFADLKGSMELLADRDPEEARKLLDPVLERMMEAVHRYEGTVNQVMGDGIMALFGAPLAHEDHAVRACYAALRHAGGGAAVRRGGPAGARRHVQHPRGPELGRGGRAGDRLRPAHGLHRRRADDPPRGPDGAAGRSRLDPPDRRTRSRLAEGYVEVKPLGPDGP